MPHDGSQPNPMMHVICEADELAVRSTLADLRKAWANAGLDTQSGETGEQVLAEVLNNVVEHAYMGKYDGRIELEWVVSETNLSCLVRDNGVAMPGYCLPDGSRAELTTNLEDLPEGGFGWFMIRSLTDELNYDRDDDWNLLTFKIERHPD